MFTWLLISALLSGLAVLYLFTQHDAPHRQRFYVAVAALCGWLVPWGLVSWQAPVAMSTVLPELQIYLPAPSFGGGQPAVLGDPDESAGTVSGSGSFSMGLLLLAACVLGLVRFLHIWIQQERFLRRLRSASQSGDHLWQRMGLPNRISLRLQNQQSGAFTSGLLRPIIWLHQDLQHSANLKAALLHETVHVLQRDNVYSTLITFIDCLLWWNPLVRFLSSQATQLQELSCDQYCKRLMPGYRKMLAELILSESACRTFAHPNMNGILRSYPKPKERIQNLENDYPLRNRHVFAGVLMCSSSAILVGCLTQQAAPFEYMGLGVIPEATESVVFYSASINNAGDKFMQRILPDEHGILHSPANVLARPQLGIQGRPPGPPLVPYNVMGTGTMAFTESGIDVSLYSAGDAVEPQVFVHHFLVSVDGEDEILSYTLKLREAPLSTLLETLAWSVRVGDEASPRLVVEYRPPIEHMVSLTGANLSFEEVLNQLSENSGCDVSTSRDDSVLVVEDCSE